MNTSDDWAEQRQRQNERVLRHANLPIKRLFALDHDAYEDGALPKKTKELLGLVASAVLRCDDCVHYHIRETLDCGATPEEITEALGIALLVGGSITIPHLRRAFALLEELSGEADTG
jgi:ribonuclease HI